MKVLVVNNQKGGVGKSTIAVHLAWYFAELGQRVLFVDLDPLRNMLETSPIRGVYELYQGWRTHPESVLAFCGARDRFTRAEAIAFVDSLKDTSVAGSVTATSSDDARQCSAPTDRPMVQTPVQRRAAHAGNRLDPPDGTASTWTVPVASAEALVRIGQREGLLLLDRQADLGADHARIRYDDGVIAEVAVSDLRLVAVRDRRSS